MKRPTPRPPDRSRCPRCRAPIYSEAGRPFCFLCGTLREWPDPAVYHENPSAPSGRRRSISRAPRAGKPWSEAEERYLKAHLADMSLEELALALGRTPKGVQTHLDLVMNIVKPYVRSSDHSDHL